MRVGFVPLEVVLAVLQASIGALWTAWTPWSALLGLRPVLSYPFGVASKAGFGRVALMGNLRVYTRRGCFSICATPICLLT